MNKNREEHKAHVKRRQAEVRKRLYEYKESNPCADCGNKYPYYVMQFDHKGDKKYTLANRSASFGSKYFAEEMAKCDLVCANCHAVRTFQRQNMAV